MIYLHIFKFQINEISIPIPGTEGPSSQINTNELRKVQRAEDILGSPANLKLSLFLKAIIVSF
jgi:hypothetical protein